MVEVDIFFFVVWRLGKIDIFIGSINGNMGFEFQVKRSVLVIILCVGV